MAQKLYDKASLVMIPSQYKEGRLFNIKPEDQAKSFEFERGSVATRVNSDGYIDYPGIKNTETIVNGSFTGGTTGWVLTPSWSYDVNRVFFDRDANRIDNLIQVNQSWTLSQGKYYRLSFDIENVDQNDLSNIFIRVLYQGGPVQDIGNNYQRYGDGTHTIIFLANDDQTRIDFYARGNTSNPGGSFYIDNISIKELSIVPRIDHSGTEPSLLLEPQRTNLILNSEDISEFPSQTTITITSNEGTSPTGANNAFKLTPTNSAGRVAHQGGGLQLNVGDELTASVYVKNISWTQLQLSFYDITNGIYSGSSNLISQTSTTEWTRVEYTYTVTQATTNWQFQFLRSGVDTGNEILAYAPQLEIGGYTTSYIPTRGTTVTRLKDICYGGGDESVFKTTEGTLFIDLEKVAYESDVYSLLSLFADSSNYIWLGYNRDFNRLYAAIRNNGSNTLITTGIDLGVSRSKMALMYSSGNSKVFVNGSQVISDTDALNFTANFQQLRFNYSATYNVNSSEMRTSAVAYFPEALTDTELQQLTSVT